MVHQGIATYILRVLAILIRIAAHIHLAILLQNHLLQLGPFQELIDLHSLPTIVSSLGTLH